ncbi:MAG: HAMP domain-containing sensor histidine kinase [Pseudomonadota bacterium]
MIKTSLDSAIRRFLGTDARLALSISVTAFAAIVAGWIGFLSYERIESRFEQVAEQRVPAMADALLLVEQAAAVNALTSSFAATSEVREYDRARERAEIYRLKVDQLLSSLSARGLDVGILSSARDLNVDLFNALDQLERLVDDRLAIAAKRRLLVAETRELHQALSAWLTPKIDDANFDLVIQTEEATESLSDQLGTLTRDGVGRLNALLKLSADVNGLTAIMANAAIAPDVFSLEQLESAFAARVQSTSITIDELVQDRLAQTIAENIALLMAFGSGNDGVFRKRRKALNGGDLIGENARASQPAVAVSAIEQLQESTLNDLQPAIAAARRDVIMFSEAAVDGSSKTINRLIDKSVLGLTSYLNIASESNWLAGLLRQAAAELDSAALGPVAEEIESAILHLTDLRSTLDLAGEPVDELDRHLQSLVAQATGESSLIALRREELRLEERLRRNVTLTHDLALTFTNEINTLLDETRAGVTSNNASVNVEIYRGRWILLALLVTVLAIAASIAFRERMYRDKLEESADELRHHHDHLQELVEERTMTISEQAEELQLALDAEKKLTGLQRQFVSMVCHEFRTPLAIIDGNAQRLIRRHDKITPEKRKNNLSKIRTAVIRLTDLMESVLSAARLEAGSISFNPAPCDLAVMIREVSDNHMDVNPSYKILVDVDQLPGSFFADIKLLRQVMSNLISNAIKYSPDAKRIWVSGRLTEEGEIKVDIRDEGVGIPEEELNKLFQRFFRASTSTGIAGTGIGLHLVKTLVDLHSGKMDVASTVGIGTTFSITLPGTSTGAAGLSDLEPSAA